MQYRITVNGKVYDVTVEMLGQSAPAPAAAAVAPAPVQAPPPPPPQTGDEQVLSPFPGNIIDVRVKVGQQVKAGQCLTVLEAMKMENEIVAPRDGVVVQVLVSKGSGVNTDDVLVVLG